MSTAVKIVPAPASAEARATKVDRVKFLERWALENPLATIEQAREAIRANFGLALGTKMIADTLRSAKAFWEKQRLEALENSRTATPASPAGPDSIQNQVARWALEMKAAGIRLVEIVADGTVRVEFEATPVLQAASH